MSYTLLRIDYNPGGTCDKCTRSLTGAKTRIAKDVLGNVCYLGPECAKSAINYDENIPNLTKEFSKHGQEQSGNGNSTSGNDQDKDLSLALAYLHLRQRSLNHFEHKSISYSSFEKLLEKYDEEKFNEDDARYVINVMKKNQRERPFLGIANLKNLYLLDFLLAKAISKINDDKRDFLANIQNNHLRKNGYLTEKQIFGACNWFENIEGLERKDIEKIKLIRD